MTLPPPKKRYTPQEYYALEQVADHKSDYYRGEIFTESYPSEINAMAAGPPPT